LRAAKTSKLVSALAILGLILVSLFTVLVLDSSSLVNPTIPLQNGNSNGTPGPTGVLVVQLHSNQNETDRLANPTSGLFAVGEWPMTVAQATNSTNPTTYAMITDTSGGSLQDLPAGNYVVSLKVEALIIRIPVQVSVGNEAKVQVRIYGSAYSLLYSEESGVLPTAGSAQSNVFVRVNSTAPVANASEPVVLKVHEGAAGSGYLVNATVISRQPPSQGTQWLELGSAAALDPVNATSIVLTTWTYATYITIGPTGLYVSADN